MSIMGICPICGNIKGITEYVNGTVGKCSNCGHAYINTGLDSSDYIFKMNAVETELWEQEITEKYVNSNALQKNSPLNDMNTIKKEIRKKILPQYVELCSKYNKPRIGGKTTAKGTMEHECWVANETFYMISTWDRVKWMIENNTYKSAEEHTFDDFVCFESIPLSRIHHFQREGELYTETQISGGGGGGSSIAGAIIGGFIAGGVGAIIGSRKQTESIKSETIRHDSREVILYYYETPTSKALTALHFESESYNGLIMTIPEKEFSAVMSKEQKLSARFATGENAQSVTDKIRELAKLRDDGIITEEEFAEKKKELLSQI